MGNFMTSPARPKAETARTAAPGMAALKSSDTQKTRAGATLPQSRQDDIALTRQTEKPFSDDWLNSLQDCLRLMGSKYPGVSITVADFSEDALATAAASYGPGRHLVASADFLQRMASSPEAYEQGKSILEDLLSALSTGDKGGQGAFLTEDSVTFWTLSAQEEDSLNPWTRQSEDDKRLLELMEDVKQKAEKAKKKFKLRISSASFSASASMARLAQARTVSDVKTVMSSARRNIGSLKIALSLSDDKQRNKLRAAISRLETVASRGGKKIRQLTEESGLRVKQEKAEKEQLRRKAEQIKQELRQRRTARHSRENAQIHEIRDRELMDWQLQQAEEALVAQLESLTGSGDTSFAAAGDAVSIEGSAAAVTLSPPVEITPAAVIAV